MHSSQIVGQISQLECIKKWIINLSPICCFVWGVSGIGKSMCLRLLLEENNYRIHSVEPEQRTKEQMPLLLAVVQIKTNPFFRKKMVLLIDDIDSNCDTEFIYCLTQLISVSKIPIVIIGNNKYNPTLKPLLVPNLVLEIKFCEIPFATTYVFTKNIIANEKIKIKDDKLRELIQQSRGDLRSILYQLELGLQGYKDNSEYNIFEITRKILSQNTGHKDKSELIKIDSVLCLGMIQENYVVNVLDKKMETLYLTAQCLSDAQLFENQYDMSNYTEYMESFITAATQECHDKATIHFIRKSSKNKCNEKRWDTNLTVLQPKQKQNGNKSKEKVPKVVKEKIPKVVKEKVPKVVKEKIPKVVKEKIPKVVKEKVPKVVKEKVPKVVKEKIPKVVKEKIPKVVKEKIPKVVKEKKA
jgi:hypothetical protein